MCGRFAQSFMPSRVRDEIPQVELEFEDAQPNSNLAPTSQIMTVIVKDGRLVLTRTHWGLIPPWAKDRKIGAKMFNARVETVHEKPLFKDAFKHRRCLIPVDGFYEWRKDSDGTKSPFFFSSSKGGLPYLAGLWEQWRDPATGEVVLSSTIVTTNADEVMAPIHDRMPLIAWDPSGWISKGTLACSPGWDLHSYGENRLVVRPVGGFTESHQG
jgi:putative SOS response-associated peptidase YedK